MTIQISAGLPRQSFVPGERIPLQIQIQNSDPNPVLVQDPRRGGSFLRFFLRQGNTPPRTRTPGEAQKASGVPEILTGFRVPVDARQVFEFDLAEMFSISRPGPCAVGIEYEWQPGNLWRAGETPFHVTPSAGLFLEVVPGDSSGGGSKTLFWGEKEGGNSRILAWDFSLQRRFKLVRGAAPFYNFQGEVSPTFSVSPAGNPCPEHWLAWLQGGHLFCCYAAESDEERSAPRGSLFVGAKVRLLSPLAADPPPDEGRPGCWMGLLTESPAAAELTVFRVDPQGQVRALAPVRLPGAFVAGWCCGLKNNTLGFLLLLQEGKFIQLHQYIFNLAGRWEASILWASLDAKFLAGDVRVAPDGAPQAGLLLEKGGNWLRGVLTKPQSDTAGVFQTFKPMPGYQFCHLRLDTLLRLHLLACAKKEGALAYYPPAADQPSWQHPRLGNTGKFFNLILQKPEEPPLLLYLDPQTGPTFVRL